MNPISSYNFPFPASSGFQGIYESYSELQITRFSYSESQTKDITIYTDEGDRVTISTDQDERNNYLTYEGIHREQRSGYFANHFITNNRSVSFQGEAFYRETTRNISISVDGDLNEQELKDIEKALKCIDKIMTNFLYGGSMANVAVQGNKIKELDTIAGLEARYGYERSVMVERTIEKETSTYSRHLDNKTSPFTNTKYLVDQLTDIIKESSLNPSTFKTPVQDLFSTYRNHLHRNASGDQTSLRLTGLLENQFMNIIENLSGDFQIS